MITTRSSLCALPRMLWEQCDSLQSSIPSIRTFVEDALAIEQRMQRNAPQSQDRSHYNLCCMSIESAVLPGLLTPITTAEQFGETLQISAAAYNHIRCQLRTQPGSDCPAGSVRGICNSPGSHVLPT